MDENTMKIVVQGLLENRVYFEDMRHVLPVGESTLLIDIERSIDKVEFNDVEQMVFNVRFNRENRIEKPLLQLIKETGLSKSTFFRASRSCIDKITEELMT